MPARTAWLRFTLAAQLFIDVLRSPNALHSLSQVGSDRVRLTRKDENLRASGIPKVPRED